jgi:CelD/BcsL family acetyltransferase involved in cellulose biosynthesis
MHAPLATALRVERRPLTGLHGLIDEWRALSARAIEPNVFYDPAFALAAAPVFGRNVDVALVWLGARLVGFFPQKIESRRYGVKLPVLVSWTHPYAPLGTPLIVSEMAQEALAAWLNHVANAPDMPGLALLPLVPEDGPFAAALNAVLPGRPNASFGRHQRAVLAPGAERADYFQRTISRKKRKEWRRQRRRLEDTGTVAFSSTAGTAATAALDDFLALEARGWKGRAGTAARDNIELCNFMRKTIADLGDRAGVHRLLLDERAVAAALTLRSGDTGWFWKIAYDEGQAQFSPGVQLARELTEMLLQDGSLARVDSCASANHPMIDRLWRERLSLADRLIGARHDAPFRLACRLEALRRAATAAAKRVLFR